jgi:hypothetical protein
MTSKEKITEILNCVQGSYMDWNCMCYLKQDLEELVGIAQSEGTDRLIDRVNGFINRD